MKIEDLLHKRVLIKDNTRWGNAGISEVKILEISPTKEWTKLMNDYGKKYWKATSDISVIEVLYDLRTGRPKS